jgi:hypothetical protein
MNLMIGGTGGRVSDETLLKNSMLLKEKWKDPVYRKRKIKESSDLWKKLWKEGKLKHTDYWTGRNHTKETKEKMRLADHSGIKNSQYGTCWITNEKESKKIYKGDLIPKGWRLGRKIHTKTKTYS